MRAEKNFKSIFYDIKLINIKKAGSVYDSGIFENGDTIYLTVADKDGNMVSLIQSNYRGMGSGMVPPNLGFMLQDRGEMFSLAPNHRNSLQGGKRPFHTILRTKTFNWKSTFSRKNRTVFS